MNFLNQNKMTKHRKVTWECGHCNKIHESVSNKRWDMQVCECGKSGYDIEEYYSRTMGEIKIIKEEILNK
jgi:hypothetical protein